MCARLFFAAVTGVLAATAWAAEISGPVKVSATTPTSAVISWQTDGETGTRVSYGPAADRLADRAEGAVGTAHEVTLSGLQPGTKYFFAVGTARKKLATGEFTASGSPVTGSAPVASSPATKPPSVLGRIFAPQAEAVPPTRTTWGNMGSLPDHFARHGGDFRAKDADDYARMAWQFGQQAKAGGLLVKLDEDGTRRVYDPKSGAFAAYNANGTTKTYFKPNSSDYFARQPGRLVNARTR